MPDKNRDRQNRWRSKTITFHVSPQENELIDELARLSGKTKQEFLTTNMLNRNIVVQGNPKVYRALKLKMQEFIYELRKLQRTDQLSPEYIELMKMICEVYKGMKEDG